jgi:hypothetical protein
VSDSRHNCYIWGSGPPRERSEREQDSPKENVWCALTYERVIGPARSFYEDFITSNLFLDVVENYTIPQLNNNNNLVLQLDGASLQFARIFRDCLNVNYPGRWTGRLGPCTGMWTPRSPDLTPLDFLLLGCVKDQVQSQRVNTLDGLKARIIAANAGVRRTCYNASGKRWTAAVGCMQNYIWPSLWSVWHLTTSPLVC